VIGAAKRATGAREKHRAAAKALTISLDAGGNCVPGLRTPNHDHTHVALPEDWFLLLQKKAPAKKVPADWNAPLVGAGYLGGIAHLVWSSMGQWGSCSTGLVPTGRIPPQTNLGRELSAAF
jgi:hypothetical protein